jgi:predicted Zn-dependent peptidase
MAKFYRKKLKNGMTVLFEQRKGSGVVSVAFATRFGSVNEHPSEKGIAHFIEHLLYKGTPTRNARQISEEIEKKGGVLNGFTSEEITAYWCKMPSKHLHVALDVLSDIVKNPLFDEKEIEKERNVIFEEMKLYQDSPHLHVHDKIMSYLFGGTLGIPIIGTEKTLKSLDKEKLRKKFEEVYSTNNLILSVVGDADFSELCKFAEKNFESSEGKIPGQRIIFHNKVGFEKRRGIGQANMVFAYHLPHDVKKARYSSQVLNAIMAGGMSSRLFSEIREKRNLAYAVKGVCNINKNFAFNSIYVGTTKKNIPLVRKIILDEFKKIRNLNEKELKEVKEQLIGNHRIAKEDSQGQMVELLAHEIFGNVDELYKYEQNIKSINLSDVKKLANFKKYSLFALVPV